ncbi:MAG TPA: hypothetical protein VFE65_19340, partial [Pseudonocardia sp.]|nr:hypothetical protein [Pseudonocardia sp.]
SLRMSAGPGDKSMESAVEALVANALDDLETECLDTAAALRLVAHQAWDLGYERAAAGNSGGGGSGCSDGCKPQQS